MTLSIPNRQESELITAILAGDTQRYHELIRPYERSVYMMSLIYMKNEMDAEDVAQETFIRAFRNLCAFRGESKFSTWLISIALNEAKNRLRRQAAFHAVPIDEFQLGKGFVCSAVLRDWRELPSELVEREEIRSLLEQAVEMLPDIYKQVFLLRDVEEFDVNETALTLRVSTSVVKVRLHRARRMLQKVLAPKLRSVNNEGSAHVETSLGKCRPSA